jgi:hypothetical protein
MMATVMIGQRTKSRCIGKLVSWSYSSYSTAATTTHLSPKMLLPIKCSTQPICCGGCRADGSNADKDVHHHLIRRALLIAWDETLRTPV